MMLSKERVKVEAIYPAPFSMNERSDHPGKGMELSYDEILRCLERINISHEGLVHKGVTEYIGSKKEFIDAPAVDDLINRANAKSKLIQEAHKFVNKMNVKKAKTILGNRQIFVSSMGLGLTVVEKQRTGKGCLEMLALAKEIQSFLKF